MVQAQDHMAWETQGPIADRTRERLTCSDRGVILLREVMMREMKRVQQGTTPWALSAIRPTIHDRYPPAWNPSHKSATIALPRRQTSNAPTELLDRPSRLVFFFRRGESATWDFLYESRIQSRLSASVSRAPDPTLSLPWHLTETMIQSLSVTIKFKKSGEKFYGRSIQSCASWLPVPAGSSANLT